MPLTRLMLKRVQEEILTLLEILMTTDQEESVARSTTTSMQLLGPQALQEV